MDPILRPWQPQDAPQLAAMLNDPRVTDNLRDGLPAPYTLEDGAAFISAMREADPNTTFVFAITVQGKAVGNLSALRQENVHRRTAEVGCYIAPPYWGRGLATRAVAQLCQHLFRTTDLLRLFAQPFADNLASCRVLEKAGFSREGVLRKNALKHGAVRDTVLYAKVRE